MASTGSEAVRFSPRFAQLGPLRHVRLTEACAALSPPRFKRAVPKGRWCMEFAASKTWGASGVDIQGGLEKWSELDALELEARTAEIAEVGAAGSTCTETTRVLENCPSLTEIPLLC